VAGGFVGKGLDTGDIQDDKPSTLFADSLEQAFAQVGGAVFVHMPDEGNGEHALPQPEDGGGQGVQGLALLLDQAHLGFELLYQALALRGLLPKLLGDAGGILYGSLHGLEGDEQIGCGVVNGEIFEDNAGGLKLGPVFDPRGADKESALAVAITLAITLALALTEGQDLALEFEAAASEGEDDEVACTLHEGGKPKVFEGRAEQLEPRKQRSGGFGGREKLLERAPHGHDVQGFIKTNEEREQAIKLRQRQHGHGWLFQRGIEQSEAKQVVTQLGAGACVLDGDGLVVEFAQTFELSHHHGGEAFAF